jgi:hypothetical protein
MVSCLAVADDFAGHDIGLGFALVLSQAPAYEE